MDKVPVLSKANHCCPGWPQEAPPRKLRDEGLFLGDGMKNLDDIERILKARSDLKHFDRAEDGLVFLIGRLRVVLSTGGGWDHVSVSLSDRTPRYQEMKMIKLLCFRPDEWAIELHPPPSRYVSIHPYVLHMWRPHNLDIPIPDERMV